MGVYTPGEICKLGSSQAELTCRKGSQGGTWAGTERGFPEPSGGSWAADRQPLALRDSGLGGGGDTAGDTWKGSCSGRLEVCRSPPVWAAGPQPLPALAARWPRTPLPGAAHVAPVRPLLTELLMAPLARLLAARHSPTGRHCPASRARSRHYQPYREVHTQPGACCVDWVRACPVWVPCSARI